jgi:hypothetical protein
MTLQPSQKALMQDTSQHERAVQSPHRKLSVNEAAAYLGLTGAP